MTRSRRLAILLPALLVLAACAPATPSAPGRDQTGQPAAPAPNARPTQTLVTVVRLEPTALATRPVTISGTDIAFVVRLFNADLDMVDGQNQARPYLAEALPQLNTDSWQVFPDGTMETRYHLRPNLSWHDGAPLTADDFVFALRVYKTPELGISGMNPITLIDDVLAPDSRTVVIRWRALFPDAGVLSNIGSLGNGGFQALPRHLMEASFNQDTPDVFANQTFWSSQYIGLGPFKLEHWEPGASVEGTAFEGHALGRPKLDRIVVRFIADENTALANLLSENVHMATGRAIRFEHTQVLRREWDNNHRGIALLTLSLVRFVSMQNRPEVASPRAMLDPRVRRAIAHSIDKTALNDGVFDGQATISDTLVAPDVPFFADLDRALTKYPYDPRRSEQLMNDAGFSKDRDGFFASPAGERFSPVFWEESGSQNEKELNVFIDTWRRAGFDMQTFVLNAVQLNDNQLRAGFPAMYTTQGVGSSEDRLGLLTTAVIPSATNRWQGMNRGAWNSPDYERLWTAYTRTLDRSERNRQLIDMLKLVSDELPLIPFYFNMAPTAHLATLKGPTLGAHVPDPRIYANIYEWELQ